METLLLFWFAFMILCAVIAGSKGRSAFGWFILGALFGILALIAIACMPSLKRAPTASFRRSSSGPINVTDPVDLKKCPACAEIVRREATICRFCGNRFDALMAPSKSRAIAFNARDTLLQDSKGIRTSRLTSIAAVLLLGALAIYSTRPEGRKAGPTELQISTQKTNPPQQSPDTRVGAKKERADKIEQASAPQQPPSKPKTVSLWQRGSDKSALTDRTSIYWVVTAKEQTKGTLGLLKYAKMQLMCHQNETRLIFDFNDYMGSDPITVAYRVDGGDVQRIRVSVSEGGRVFGFWNGTGIPLAKQIQNGNEMVVSAKPYNEPATEAIFPITRMEEAVSDVRKQCGW